MVIVTLVQKDDGSFSSLEAKGHADSGEWGHDLVCAAVSSVIVGGINNLQDGDENYVASVEKGHVTLKSVKPLSQHDEIVVETIIKQIESLASSYPRNVKLERKNDNEIRH